MDCGPRRTVRLQSRLLGIAGCIPHFVCSPSGRQSLVFQLVVICKVTLTVWFEFVLHLESSIVQCCLVQRRLNEAKSAFQTPWWTRYYNLTLSVNHLHSLWGVANFCDFLCWVYKGSGSKSLLTAPKCLASRADGSGPEMTWERPWGLMLACWLVYGIKAGLPAVQTK